MKGEKRKFQVHVMDLCLVIVALVVIAFTIAMTFIYCRYGAVPDSLVISVFGICGGECGFLAMIRTAKEKNMDRKREMEDREYLEKQEAKYREEVQNSNGDPTE